MAKSSSAVSTQSVGRIDEITGEVLASLIRQPDALAGLNALPVEEAGSVLYSPQLAVGDFGLYFRTRLNVVNVGNGETTVTVALLDESGAPLVPDTKLLDLVPGAHFSLDVGSFFGLELGQGYVRISASGDGKLLGNILFGDGDPGVNSLKFAATLPLYASGSRNFLFAHLAQGGGYYTGVAFLAPEGAEVTVEAFDNKGAAKGSPFQLHLEPGQRLASLLMGLIPETAGQLGGYVRVTSDRPVISFELFGTADGQVLSAVPPQRLPG